jgi:hypothetical protein
MPVTTTHIAFGAAGLAFAHLMGWFRMFGSSVASGSNPTKAAESAVIQQAESVALPLALDKVPTQALVDYLSARLSRERAQAEASAKSQALLDAIVQAHAQVTGVPVPKD